MSEFSQSSVHYSVLWKEAGEFLDIQHSINHVDATLGMGGHVSYFLDINPNLHVIGFDQDENARVIARKRLEHSIQKHQCEIVAENFEKLEEVLDAKEFRPTSILFDIGVSSLQFDDGERGFSFRFEAPLDMRMNREKSLTAKEIVNTWSEEALKEIFYKYGEEKHSALIVRKMIAEREKSPFETTVQLADFIASVKPFKKKKQKQKNEGGHPATLIFQALRIAVNRELEVLETAIHQAVRVLKKGGRLAIITFHSLEDRIVKHELEKYISKEKVNKYKEKKREKEEGREREEYREYREYREEEDMKNKKYCLRKITKKPILPSLQEIEENPRSRSAKMRVVEKL